MSHAFEFGGQLFEVAGEAALYWPAEQALLVSDLHLEKASAYALNGQMLPPYDSIATLEDIAALCTKYTPAKIISLGDNFHDDDGEARLAEPAAALLIDLARDTEWLWITGNHDRAVSGIWGGKTPTERGVVLKRTDMRKRQERVIKLRNRGVSTEEIASIVGIRIHQVYRIFTEANKVRKRENQSNQKIDTASADSSQSLESAQ